jgi:hypothetical protein
LSTGGVSLPARLSSIKVNHKKMVTTLTMSH